MSANRLPDGIWRILRIRHRHAMQLGRVPLGPLEGGMLSKFVQDIYADGITLKRDDLVKSINEQRDAAK